MKLKEKYKQELESEMSKIKNANREGAEQERLQAAELARQGQGGVDDELTEHNLRLVEEEFLMNYRAPVP